jgi:predicted nucleotidyltransferase
MLLAHRFPDPALDDAVEDLLSRLDPLLRDHLLSVIVHGSAVLGDFVPGHSDLDFVAIVDHDLSEGELQTLVNLRQVLRTEARSSLSGALEGAFLPRRIVGEH